MAQRYQDGHLRKAKRKRGPDVWEFRWRERGPDGKRRQRTLTVGNVEELRTEREALNRIQMLRLNINRDLSTSALMTFGDLVTITARRNCWRITRPRRPGRRTWCTSGSGFFRLGVTSTCTT